MQLSLKQVKQEVSCRGSDKEAHRMGKLLPVLTGYTSNMHAFL